MLLRTFTSTLMFVKCYATPRLVLRGDYRETLPPQPDIWTESAVHRRNRDRVLIPG